MKDASLNNQQNCEYDIEIFDLCKRYNLKGKKKIVNALESINLKVKRGEILGLLGPNGAGKTTMVSILSTLIQPTSGTARVLGYDVVKQPWFVKTNIGLMFGSEMIYHRLTGYRNLKYFCRLYAIKNYKERIREVSRLFNLEKWLNQYVDQYSRGMKLKLALARVLIIQPKILFLDEPMLGLDPTSVKSVINILINLNTTIFITSHQMNVVEQLCDKIAFLKKGKIIKVDTPDNIKRYISKKTIYELTIDKNKNELINKLKNLDFVSDLKDTNELITFSIENVEDLPPLFNCLKDYPVKRFNQIEPTLDELFLKFSN